MVYGQFNIPNVAQCMLAPKIYLSTTTVIRYDESSVTVAPEVETDVTNVLKIIVMVKKKKTL